MRIHITIDCDNDAFGESDARQCAEIRRILTLFCEGMSRQPKAVLQRMNADPGAKLLDANGNSVGYARVTYASDGRF